MNNNSKLEAEGHRLVKNKTKKMDLIFEEIRDALFLHDFKGDIIKANKSACHFLGLTKEEVKALNVIDLMSSNLLDNNSIDFKELLTKKYIRFETILSQINKTHTPIEVTSNVIKIDKTNLILSCIKDISVRKNYEKELVEARKLAEDNQMELNAIFNNSPASIFLFDEKMQIQRVNKKAIKKFQINSSNLNNERLGDLINCANTKNRTIKCGKSEACESCRLNNIFRQTIINGKSFTKEEIQILIKRDESYFEKTVLVSTSLLKRNGHSTFLATLDDISKRKEMEQELIEAKIKAQESEKLKSAFLNNLSHEIRTPLNGILGFIDFFEDDNISLEDRKEYIEIMHKSGDRLINTVNDLVNVSKINSGLMELRNESFNLVEIIDSFVLEQNLNQKNSNINFILNVDPNLKGKLVYSDKLKLLQALRNLLDNAFKFTSKGFIRLDIKAENNDVAFSIQDSGIGISTEHHNQIFKPFWQVESNLSRAYDGNGLGLTVAQKLVNCLGGDLFVKSDLGIGSTFFFHLTDVIEKVAEVKTISETQSSFSGKIILICEDELSNYLYLEAILLQENCKLIHALNGKEALDIIKENNDIDLVLMDLKMPVMDGFESTKKIRAIKNSIPIIAQSAYVLNGEDEKALKAGCNEFISKPLSKELLIKTVAKYLRSK